MKIKIGYVDMSWWDADNDTLSGDMSFSFNNGDSRVLAKDIETEIREPSIEYINSDSAEDDCGEDMFAIYELHTAVVDVDDDDMEEGDTEEDAPLTFADIVNGTDKLVEVYVCATRAQAEGIIKEYYGNIKAYYRNESDPNRMF